MAGCNPVDCGPPHGPRGVEDRVFGERAEVVRRWGRLRPLKVGEASPPTLEALEPRRLVGWKGLENVGCGDCLSSEEEMECDKEGLRDCAFSSEIMSA